MSVASSLSPSAGGGDRILSEQSENTLDSDSKLSLSFQSKLVRSPPNTSNGNSTAPERQTEKEKGNAVEEDVVSSGRRSPESNSIITTPFPLASSEKINAISKPNNAEQDMFSEHFDVSIEISREGL